MPKCKIDGIEYEFKPGETIIQLADRVGVPIPRYCYHPALTVVAQCRMCAVEVEKMPKLQTACSTPLSDGMSVSTKSDKVKQMQSSVMEFLLINHPLDCPICDKSGECDLQNYSYDYGAPDSRYEEQRRTYIDLDMGPVIKKNMNRCIHCTRCIRFCDEISGFREMIAVQRGNNTEITTCEGKPLESEYAGNLADICPTGSLTLKEFRFKKRVWYLKKTPSICEGCSQGCNIEVHQEQNVIYRLLPRTNMEINKYWLCDEGRFNFHYVNSGTRILEPMHRVGGTLSSLTWDAAMLEVRSILKGKVLVLVGSDLTQEEITTVKEFASSLKDSAIYHFGTPGVTKAVDDVPTDKILRRSSKTANLHGAEKLGLKGYSDQADYDSVFIFSGGRAKVPTGLKGPIVAAGVFEAKQAEKFNVVLPSLSYAEKSGTILNHQGKEQKFKKAMDPRGQSKAVIEIINSLKDNSLLSHATSKMTASIRL